MSGETLGVLIAVYLSNWGNYTRAGRDLFAIACPAPMPTRWRRGGSMDVVVDLLDRLLYIAKRLPAIGLVRDAGEPDPP